MVLYQKCERLSSSPRQKLEPVAKLESNSVSPSAKRRGDWRLLKQSLAELKAGKSKAPNAPAQPSKNKDFGDLDVILSEIGSAPSKKDSG